jgi:hypothetical protein
VKKLDTFTEAYIVCALWSSTDNADESGGSPLDDKYTMADIDPTTLAIMISDCEDFQTANAELLAQAAEEHGYTLEQAGHDFWLTRNRHGAGFWDRGLGEIGKRLTDMAHPYGEVDLYVGDDDKIYA